MVNDTHLTEFAGKPVRDVPADGSAFPADVTRYAWRVGLDGSEAFEDDHANVFLARLTALTQAPYAADIDALLLGAWGPSDSAGFWSRVEERLTAFPKLEHLFLGEMTYEEMEISWINWDEPSSLLNSLPGLRTLYMRGGSDDCHLKPLALPLLEKLVIQSGSLPEPILSAVFASRLPALRTLELWLGSDEYGGITDVQPLAPLLQQDVFPTIDHLGLRNSVAADAIAAALDGAPVLEHVSTLDLGGGTLTDTGAQHLVDARLGAVSRFLLHHHFVSPEMLDTLRRAHPGLEVDADKAKKRVTISGEVHMFTEVSE